MNHKPSQFCGPPTREGATLDVPLPQSATLSDMCVNGPIVYECLDSVLRSQVHLLQRKMPQLGTILSPWWAGPGVRLRVSHVRENGRMSCVCLAACVTGKYARLGENACRDGKKIQITSEEKQNWEMRLAKVSGTKFCLWKRGWSSNPWKEELWIWKKKIIVITRILFFLFLFWIIVKLVLIDTGQCY